MLLLLVHRGDEPAHAFAADLPDGAARVMTCAQLCELGVRWRMDDSAAGTPQISWRAGEPALDDIDGVITRLTVIGDGDLPHIVEPDRAYVAAEMHAFLLALLDALPYPLLNRPSPACLYGPALRNLQWREHARALDIPVAPMRAGDSAPERDAVVDATLIGERVVGTDDARLARWSRALAARVGATYLAVRFHGRAEAWRFVGAETYPRLELPSVRAALVEHFKPQPSGGAPPC